MAKPETTETDPKKKGVVTARVTRQLQDTIDDAARKTGKTRTEFMVSAVEKELALLGYLPAEGVLG